MEDCWGILLTRNVVLLGMLLMVCGNNELWGKNTWVAKAQEVVMDVRCCNALISRIDWDRTLV